ncbi:MAG TPA: hypothetical protein V6C89_08695 [Drouetiella sp.]|jgi:hypothetical protein
MMKRTANRLGFANVVASLSLAVSAATETVTADNFVDVRLKKNMCINVGLRPPLRNQTSEQFLLSIDGKDVSKNSFAEVQKMLAGPSGTQVEVEIGYPSGDTEKFKITRSVSSTRPARSVDPFQELSNRLLQQRQYFNSANLVENSSYNSDLVTRVNCIQAVEHNRETGRRDVGTLMNCFLVSVSSGDLKAVDQYLVSALDLMKSGTDSSNLNYREKAVIEDLILLNRNEDAESICKYLLHPDANHSGRLPQPITVLTSYSLIPTKSAKDACKQLAEQIFSGQTKQVTSFGEDSYWLAQYLESIQEDNKALELYSTAIEKLRNPSYPPNFYGTQQIAFGLYSRARLEAKVGKRDAAEKDLEAIKTTYRVLTAKQQSLISKIPELFPNFVDAENALSALKKSGAISPPPAVTSYMNQDPFIESGSLPAFKQTLQNAKLCHSMITANKKAEADSAVKKLLVAYNDSDPPRAYSVRQNLFSTILHMARLCSDHGWYDESNRILSSLESAAKNKIQAVPPDDIGWSMISAEKIYNAAAMSGGKDPGESLWLAINPGIRAPNGLSLADRLSVLAKIYCLAEEQKRAKLFIDHAIKDIDTANGVYGTNAAAKQAVIYMNAAFIYARQSDFRNAENFSKLAFSSSKRLTNDLALALSDAADALSSQGKVEAAISIIEQASKMENASGPRMYESNFARKLAELYAKNGQVAKAVPVIANSLGVNGKISSSQDYALAAQLSEQSKDFAAAAKFYYEAGKLYGTGLTNDQRESMLRKSIDCASKVNNFDKYVLAKTYRELSNVMSSKGTSVALPLLEKSASLMPDSAQEKPEVLSSLSYLRADSKRAVQQTGISKAGLTDELNAADYELRKVPAQQAAELASKNGLANAGDFWLRLARLEVQAKHIDEAVAATRKAIASYRVANVKSHMFSQLIDADIPLSLAKIGAPDKAETILREAQKQVDTAAGNGSLQSQVQLCHHFVYLYSQKLYSQADAVLDKLLNTNLNQGHYAPPNHNHFACRFGGPYPVESTKEVLDKLLDVISSGTAGTDTLHEVHALNKILDAEKRQFGSDDYRVASVFLKIARVYSSANQNDEAYKNFMAALNIMHRYESLTYVMLNLGSEFPGVMQKLNKQSELEKLEAQKIEEQKTKSFRPSSGSR